MLLPLVFPQWLLDEVATALQKAYPREGCGILIGRDEPGIGRTVHRAVRASNVWNVDAEQTHRFLIDPRQQIQAERDAREAGMSVVGFYHSHPDAAPVPSAFDLEAAWPVYSYVIVAVTAAGMQDVRSWMLEETPRRRFLEQPVLRR